MALLNFNAAEVPAAKPFEPIPAGWYDAKIINSELKPTSNGTGTRLNLTFEIIGGEYNNRKVFEGLNVKNTSEKAQQIAQEQLSAICHAINVIQLKNTEQLHGKPLRIKVKVRPEDKVGGYDARNEINGYENINGKNGAAAAGTGAPAPQRTTAAPQRTAGAPARTAPAAGARPAGFGNRAAASAATTQAQTTEADSAQPWDGEGDGSAAKPLDEALADIENNFGHNPGDSLAGASDVDAVDPDDSDAVDLDEGAQAALEGGSESADEGAPWDK